MKPSKFTFLLLLSVAVVPASAAPQEAQNQPDAVSAIVTVISHRKGAPLPELTKGDIVVRQDGNVRPVLGWEPLRGAKGGVDLAVLIDDTLDPKVSLQWTELARFIKNLPPESRVAIAYGDHGSATMVQRFTSDREQAINALRLPAGQFDTASTIYLALADLVNRWPADHNRRVVLLISDGIDIYYGISQSTPGQNLNLQRAINAAQKKGVIVNSIFASGASAYSRNIYLINNGQSCLARLTLETGGNNYQVGSRTPVNIAPFLEQITDTLSRQYRLTFRAKLSTKAGFARLQLAVEQRDIELEGPWRVYLPSAR